MKCDICKKEFEKAKSLSNHIRWCSDDKKYLAFKKSFSNKCRIFNLGKKNGLWKGDKVGYGALHDYIKNHILKKNACENCGFKTNKLDLVNISNKYLRDVKDYEWLCRKCHMTKDNRILNLKRGKKNALQ